MNINNMDGFMYVFVNILNVADVIITKSIPDWFLYEVNPLITNLYDKYGDLVFIFKMLFVLVATSLYYHYFKYTIYSHMAFTFLTLFYVVVVVINLSVLLR